ncbi:hypothetical protein JL720_16672 [Aureococcus anophagefferens]|nr:hypothetical protein JL720_16672 [Aureococcus anophagefferens]
MTDGLAIANEATAASASCGQSNATAANASDVADPCASPATRAGAGLRSSRGPTDHRPAPGPAGPQACTAFLKCGESRRQCKFADVVKEGSPFVMYATEKDKLVFLEFHLSPNPDARFSLNPKNINGGAFLADIVAVDFPKSTMCFMYRSAEKVMDSFGRLLCAGDDAATVEAERADWRSTPALMRVATLPMLPLYATAVEDAATAGSLPFGEASRAKVAMEFCKWFDAVESREDVLVAALRHLGGFFETDGDVAKAVAVFDVDSQAQR